MNRSYPELLAILRKEFAPPYTAVETLAAIKARLEELEPGRTLHVLTRGDTELVGLAEGRL